MKKTLIIALSVAAALAGCGVFLLVLHFRSQTPEKLLHKLAKGVGDREELIMRLNVARGDTIGPMINALKDESAPVSFRADVLELLFKRNLRSSDARIEKVVLEAIEHPDPTIRRRAAYGLAVYSDNRLRIALVDSISDPDPEIRRQVYLVLSGHGGEDGENDIWQSLSGEQKEKMIEACREQMKTEETPEMRLLARAVIGREIETRGDEARRALQSSDLVRAEEILHGALELDPENAQAQIRLARFYLKNGDKEKALELAREYGGLIEVPLLSEEPVIDGDPTDAVWAEAYTTDQFYMTVSRWAQQPMKGKSRAYIGHRDGRIHIAVVAYEEDMSKLIVRHTGRDSPVWRDDCVEIVFDPDSMGKDFYQFVINPNGALYDSTNFNEKRNFKCEYRGGLFNERGYWACEFAIDGRDLDNHLIRPGTIWSLNVFRVRIGAASEHGAIWPPFGRTHRMHLYPIAIFK